jgi:hypothetical protein
LNRSAARGVLSFSEGWRTHHFVPRLQKVCLDVEVTSCVTLCP